MNLRYALIAMTSTLAIFQASAGTQADRTSPKMPADIENLAMRVGESFFVVRTRLQRRLATDTNAR